MEIKEHKKVIPAYEEITYTYHGKCPVCGFEQNMTWNSPSLDKECSECKQKRETIERHHFFDNCIDATVIKYDDSNDGIILKLKDNRVYELTGDWCVNELHDNDIEV